MDDGWQRHEREIAKRNSSMRAPPAKFSCGAHQRLQTGAVRSRVTELPIRARLTLRPKYRQIIPRLAAPQSISSICMMWSILWIALGRFAEKAALVSKRSFFVFASGRRPFTIQLNLVVNLGFGRQKFSREIKRNTRFGFCLDKVRVVRRAICRIPETVRRRSCTDSGSRENNWQSVNASTDAVRGDPFKTDSSPKKSPSRKNSDCASRPSSRQSPRPPLLA